MEVLILLQNRLAWSGLFSHLLSVGAYIIEMISLLFWLSHLYNAEPTLCKYCRILVFLDIFLNFQENFCAGVTFNEVADAKLSTALINDSSTDERVCYRKPPDCKVSRKAANFRDFFQ